MQIFRVTENTIGQVASVKPVVVILSPNISESVATSIKTRFPNALRIAEVSKGEPAKDGYFSILRIKVSDLEEFDYDLKGCKAMIIEGYNTMFYSDLLAFRDFVAIKAGLVPERVRFCCNFLSEPGGNNFSCYSAGALRDYATEDGLVDILPTSKQEVLRGNSLCRCVKER